MYAARFALPLLSFRHYGVVMFRLPPTVIPFIHARSTSTARCLQTQTNSTANRLALSTRPWKWYCQVFPSRSGIRELSSVEQQLDVATSSILQDGWNKCHNNLSATLPDFATQCGGGCSLHCANSCLHLEWLLCRGFRGDIWLYRVGG